MKTTDNGIGELVRKYREKAGLTQLDLSEKLGYDSPQFVSLFERGLSKIPLNTIGKISSILGIPEKIILDTLVETYRSTVKEKMKLTKKASS